MCSVAENYCKPGSTFTLCTLDISKVFDRVNNNNNNNEAFITKKLTIATLHNKLK